MPMSVSSTSCTAFLLGRQYSPCLFFRLRWHRLQVVSLPATSDMAVSIQSVVLPVFVFTGIPVLFSRQNEVAKCSRDRVAVNCSLPVVFTPRCCRRHRNLCIRAHAGTISRARSSRGFLKHVPHRPRRRDRSSLRNFTGFLPVGWGTLQTFFSFQFLMSCPGYLFSIISRSTNAVPFRSSPDCCAFSSVSCVSEAWPRPELQKVPRRPRS